MNTADINGQRGKGNFPPVSPYVDPDVPAQ
jgi:hypothetical protein